MQGIHSSAPRIATPTRDGPQRHAENAAPIAIGAASAANR